MDPSWESRPGVAGHRRGFLGAGVRWLETQGQSGFSLWCLGHSVCLVCDGALVVRPSRDHSCPPLLSFGAEHLIGWRRAGNPGSRGAGPSSKLVQDIGTWGAHPEQECSGWAYPAMGCHHLDDISWLSMHHPKASCNVTSPGLPAAPGPQTVSSLASLCSSALAHARPLPARSSPAGFMVV